MDNKKHSFYAMLARMKYIERWALMRNTFQENIQEHSQFCQGKYQRAFP